LRITSLDVVGAWRAFHEATPRARERSDRRARRRRSSEAAKHPKRRPSEIEPCGGGHGAGTLFGERSDRLTRAFPAECPPPPKRGKARRSSPALWRAVETSEVPAARDGRPRLPQAALRFGHAWPNLRRRRKSQRAALARGWWPRCGFRVPQTRDQTTSRRLRNGVAVATRKRRASPTGAVGFARR
jgi:hypothetical protein